MHTTNINHTYTYICIIILKIYRKCEKIRWAKHLRFQPYEYFVEILSRCIDHQCLLFTYSEKFTGKLSRYSQKPRKFSPENLSLLTVVPTLAGANNIQTHQSKQGVNLVDIPGNTLLIHATYLFPYSFIALCTYFCKYKYFNNILFSTLPFTEVSTFVHVQKCSFNKLTCSKQSSYSHS